MISRPIAFAAASLLALTAATPALAGHHAETAEAAASGAAAIGPWGVDLEARDLSIDPGNDFYQHAGGSWMRNTEMPGDHSRYGSFDILRESA